MSQLSLRPAVESDLGAMTDIYAHHVLQGTGSFEEIPPDVCEMRKRWKERVEQGYPTLIAEIEQRVVGFAYANAYKSRSAYRFTVEDSIYVAPKATGRGVGRTLLQSLIQICTEQNYRQMIAIVGDSANEASIAVHTACGFSVIGTARELGFKHGRWLDIVFMQRPLKTDHS
ncbi:MAG: N-acetyltransferase family protein [Granulosicoccus sp.]